jgi:hypothetical protein
MKCFALGFAAGSFPTLINLAGQLTKDPGLTIPGLGFWMGVAIYMGVGGIVAAVFAKNSIQEAFKLGVIAPALILSFLSGAAVGQKEGSGNATAEAEGDKYFFVSQAFAQEPQAKDGFSVNIKVLNGLAESNGATINPIPYQIIKVNPQNGQKQSTPGELVFGSANTIEVPEGGVELLFGSGENKQKIEIPNDGIGSITATKDVSLTIKSTEKTFKDDFWNAIQGQNYQSVNEFSVEKN